MLIAIILAAGKGTRIKSTDRNKVTLPFLNKPLIVYAVELFEGIVEKEIIVIGAFHESVKEALKNHDVDYAYQKDQLGTGHAVAAGLKEAEKLGLTASQVFVCYGDHSMFYKKETVKKLITLHNMHHPVISILTTDYLAPDKLAWGRILRDPSTQKVIGIVEQKDATEEQKYITEINPGFYLFDATFLKEALPKIQPSTASGEYYVTDLIKIAYDEKKSIEALKVPFTEVGIGINKREELEESQKIYLSNKEM